MKTHKDLEVWRESMELVTSIYQVTKTLPDDEKFGLISQLRRSSVSIPSNIAEGAVRSSQKDFIKFLYYALGSASELDTQLLITKNLQLIADETYIQITVRLESISKMLIGLIRSIEKRQDL